MEVTQEQQDVADAKAFLEDVRDQCRDLIEVEGEPAPSIDVRAQVLDGAFYFHSGDPSYDTDHRGGWGIGSVALDDTDEDLAQLAIDLIAEAHEDAIERGEVEREGEEVAPLGEIMARQAAQARAAFEAATVEEPITLSPALYDKLRPEQRARYRRG